MDVDGTTMPFRLIVQPQIRCDGKESLEGIIAPGIEERLQVGFLIAVERREEEEKNMRCGKTRTTPQFSKKESGTDHGAVMLRGFGGATVYVHQSRPSDKDARP